MDELVASIRKDAYHLFVRWTLNERLEAFTRA